MAELTSAEKHVLAQLEQYVNLHDDPSGSFKGMLFGKAGSGKTVLSMQLAQAITPTGKTICYIDSAQAWWFIPDKLKERSFRLAANNIDTIATAARAVSLGIGPFSAVGTIVIDEFSSYANMDLLDVTKKEAKDKDGKDPNAPEWRDMNISSNRLLKLSVALITMDKVNVILCAHERVDKGNNDIMVTSPLHLPKFGARLEGLLHLVGHVVADLQKNSGGEAIYTREVQVHPTVRVSAKTKIGGINKIKITPRELVDIIKTQLKQAPVEDKPIEDKPVEDFDAIISQLEGE